MACGDVIFCPGCRQLYDKRSYCRPCAGELHWWQKGKGMDIREAITKAGPGGKIRREGAKMWVIVPEGKLVGWNTDNPPWTFVFSAEDLTATDWQVVPEERIEVGDTVRAACDTFSGDVHCEVLKVGGSQARLGKCQGICSCSDKYIASMKLIHKGSKHHVFEAVNISMAHGNNFNVSAVGNGYNLMTLPGKVRMTLEEME